MQTTISGQQNRFRVRRLIFAGLLLLALPSNADEDVRTRDPVNPHFRASKCAVCHPGGVPPRIDYKKIGDLCISCHDDEGNRTEIHPSGIASHRGAVRMVPPDFPLLRGQLCCTTCHDVRIQCEGGKPEQEENPFFLRDGPYAEPWDVCFRCHDAALYDLFDPHHQMDDQGDPRKETCFYCHKPPYRGSRPDAIVGEPIQDICKSCHRMVKHPTGTDHMRKPSRNLEAHLKAFRKKKKLFIPLNRQGEIYCATCHNPHEKGVFPLGDPRSMGAEGDKLENHRMRIPAKLLCVACHDRGRYGGMPVNPNR